MYTIFQRTEISEPALFHPSDIIQKMQDFPEICVSTFSENIIQKFSSLDGVEKIAELYSANGVLPIYKIEEVVAMGAKKYVLFGSCGVLDDEKVKDHIIVPVSAIRDEGTSYHYQAPSAEIEADTHSIEIVENVLKNCGYSYIKGKTWTSDAIYRETCTAIAERKAEGCLCVEMECASMLAVSKYRQIPFIQFLYGADDLSSDTWDIRDLHLHGLNHAEKYMLLAFECGLAI